MKKLFITTFLLLGLISTRAFSLPNFWYSAIAYNSLGQIITTSPLANVEVKVADGINIMTQTYTNVPVNGFGVFTVYVNGAGLGAINMVAGTNISLKVNGVTVVGSPLSSTYILNNILPAGGSSTDQTIDAWVNNFPQTRVELGTLSDGTTARPLGTEFVVLDNGKVGIGTSSPSSQLQINSTGNGILSTSTSGMSIWGIASNLSSAGVLGDNTIGEAVVGRNRGGDGVGAVVGRNDSSGYGVRGFNTMNGIGVLGQAGYGGGTGIAGRFENINTANTSTTLEVETKGIGKGINVITKSGTGVFATSEGMSLWGITSVMSGAGVLGDNTFGEAVVGRNRGGDGVGAVVGRNDSSGYGVRGFNTMNGIGVLGQAGYGGGTGIAGRFENLNAANTNDALQVVTNSSGNAARFTGNVVITGNLNVSGTVAKGGGSFVIDHPLDPLNKKLFHSFVESPDMKNIYDGNVILNKLGEAVITLPDWFGAVNGDFRYQLTAIGGPGAGLYIAQEISNNQFKIAGGTAGLKVSWQVTGIRKDVWAEKNRIQVEVNKVGDEKGQYIHPDAYGVVSPKNTNSNSIQISNSNLPSNQPKDEKSLKVTNVEKNSQMKAPEGIPSNQKNTVK